MVEGESRHSYYINIPKDATPEEIKEFMKEFLDNWGKGEPKKPKQPKKPKKPGKSKKPKPSEPDSKQE